MTSVVCPKCNGAGSLAVDDPERRCEAEIVVGHETIGCFASRQHSGQPHMAILCDPCPACGGFDEHHESCGTYDMEPRPERSDWWAWRDGDLALTRAGIFAGQAWRNEYQPDSPWATISRGAGSEPGRSGSGVAGPGTDGPAVSAPRDDEPDPRLADVIHLAIATRRSDGCPPGLCEAVARDVWAWLAEGDPT